ncbi:MAG: hypothetical protein JWQ67_2589 [Marmoricola sp.]|nr:hypothetical protein [Marmoricola sp.]
MSAPAHVPLLARVRGWVGSRPDLVTVVFVASLVVGSALRVVGLTWGLPVGLHPDEPIIVKGALDLAQRNSFEPKYFMRPDHVEIQLSYLAYELYSHLFAHTGVEQAYAASPGTFLLISRAVTAAFGIATIVLAYLIGRRFDRRVGAMAALLFALTSLLVRDAHYATPDIPLTCMLMVVVLALMHYLSRPGLAPLLVACAATSVGTAIKYPALVATLMIAVVVVVAAAREHRLRRVLTHGAVSLAAVIGFLFVVSPVLFTDFAAVREQLTEQSGANHPGADGLGYLGNLVFYAGNFLTDAGLLLSLACLVGVVATVRHRMLEAVPLALGVVYWVVLSAVPLHWDRWGIPMFITPLFLAPIGLLHAYEWAGAQRWRTPVAWVVGTLVVANLLAAAIARVSTLAAPDTRLEARSYLAQQGITTADASYEGYSPLRPGSTRTVFDDFETVDGRLEPVSRHVRYLVLSSCTYNRYFRDPGHPEERAFYAAVGRSFTLLRSYTHVPTLRRSGVEVVDIVRSVRQSLDYLGGGRAGCDLEIYRTD